MDDLIRRVRLLKPGETPPADETGPHTPISMPQPSSADAIAFKSDQLLDFLAPARAPGELGWLGGYRVLRVLGSGGMGIVFEAEDVQLKRSVALKVMRPALAASATARQRFLREAQATAAIQNDHVVPIFQVGEDRGIPFLAMPLLKGETLEDHLKRQKRLPVDEVLRIGREAAEGLAAAHARGLIHRDVKPGNLWLERERGRVKVLDFGLARESTGDAQLTLSGTIMGTPAYMAPEQARGEKADARSDLFSLGCVLYRLCTGETPFKGVNTTALLLSLAMDQPKPPRQVTPHLPPALDQLVMRLLEKDPAKRPASAAVVIKALAKQSGGVPRALPVAVDPTVQLRSPWVGIDQPTAAAPAIKTAAASRVTPRKPRRPLALAVAAAFLFLIGGGVLLQQIIIRITDKDGKTREIEVKPGEKIEIVQKPTDNERAAAEWVLSVGGKVHVDSKSETLITKAVDLPKAPFVLTGIWLMGNRKVTDRDLARFKACKGLWQLGLEGTQVTDTGFAQIKGFASANGLAELYVSRTSITDAGLAHLKDRTSLHGLQIADTAITDAGLAHLKEWKNLLYIWLHRTKVTEAGIRKLAADLPKCKIDWDGGVIEPKK